MSRRPDRPLRLDVPRDTGEVLDDAWRLYRRHWRTLILIAAVVVVPVQLIVFGAGLGWLTQGYDATATPGEAVAGTFAQLLVATPLVTAMTVHVVLDAAEGGGGVHARRSILEGLEAFRHLFGPIVLVGLGVGLGLLVLVVPGIFLAVRWAVVPQVVVVEARQGTQALSGSWALTRGQGWLTFLVLFVANVVVGVVGVAFSYPLQLAAEAADAQSLLLLGDTLGQVVSLPLLAVALTLLYFSLRATRSGAGRHRPPAAPEAPRQQEVGGGDDPFGRRREEGWEPPVSGY